MSKWRHGDISASSFPCPQTTLHLPSGTCLTEVTCLLNAVAIHEGTLSARVDLEHQLQIMMSSSALVHC